MAEIIRFEDIRRLAKRWDAASLFRRDQPGSDARSPNGSAPAFPSARTGISANLGDLFEQANAVAMRHYSGDPKVPAIVAEKCVELLAALSQHAAPE